MKFGRAIRLLRAARGLQQRDVAQRAGLDASYVSLLEAEKRSASPEAVEAIAMALTVPISVLRLLAADENELRGIAPPQAQELGLALARLLAESGRERKRADADA